MYYAVGVVVVLSPEPPERDVDQGWRVVQTCHDKNDREGHGVIIHIPLLEKGARKCLHSW